MTLVLRGEVSGLDPPGDVRVDLATFEEVVDLLVGEAQLVFVGSAGLAVQEVGRRHLVGETIRRPEQQQQ